MRRVERRRARGLFRITTANVDFALSLRWWRSDVRRFRGGADVLAFQEAKWLRVRLVLVLVWAVFQRASSDAHAGSALAWRRKRAVLIEAGQKLATKPAPGILARYLTWCVLELPGHRRVAFISAHRPPARYAHLWPEFDAALVELVRELRARGWMVCVAGDFNQRVHELHGLAGLIAYGYGIDGFLVCDELAVMVERVEHERRGRSDHRPVSLVLAI